MAKDDTFWGGRYFFAYDPTDPRVAAYDKSFKGTNGEAAEIVAIKDVDKGRLIGASDVEIVAYIDPKTGAVQLGDDPSTDPAKPGPGWQPDLWDDITEEIEFPDSWDDPPAPKAPVCECGSDAIRGAGHSSWCPKA